MQECLKTEKFSLIQASLNRDKSNSWATFPISVLKNIANESCGPVHLSTHGHSVLAGLLVGCPLLVQSTEPRVSSFLMHKLWLENKNGCCTSRLALEKKVRRTLHCHVYWILEVAWLVLVEYLLMRYTHFIHSTLPQIFVEFCSQQALG